LFKKKTNCLEGLPKRRHINLLLVVAGNLFDKIRRKILNIRVPQNQLQQLQITHFIRGQKHNNLEFHEHLTLDLFHTVLSEHFNRYDYVLIILRNGANNVFISKQMSKGMFIESAAPVCDVFDFVSRSFFLLASWVIQIMYRDDNETRVSYS